MAILDQHGSPMTEPDPNEPACDHGIVFDEEAARNMTEREVRKRFPRLYGNCPKGCGFNGIGYASWMHYIMGDW